MMYPYMTLNDDTEITHSEMKPNGRVKVYIETQDINDGFHNAVCESTQPLKMFAARRTTI